MNNRLYKDKIPFVKSDFRSGYYLYTTNSPTAERSFFQMEMMSLFEKQIDKKHFFSSIYVDPSRSPYIKHCISIRYIAPSIEELTNMILKENFKSNNFKVCLIDIENEKFSFHEKRKIEGKVGMNIEGFSKMDNPDFLFGVARVDGNWIFGECESSDYRWQQHKTKPYSYSNALNVEVSRALVNIAASRNLKTLIDPCCGIGTVVIEALDMGYDIKGYEINPSICSNAKKNLEYFGFKDVITLGDMNSITDHFDASIVDLPYGVFTNTTAENQFDIIKCARRISDRMVIVTFEDMANQIKSAGFNIIDKCAVTKGRFTRYISMCK